MFRKEKNFVFIEPDYKISTTFIPNDPDWSLQWAPSSINCEDGWNIQKGNDSVIISIIDTGVDYNHPDLNHYLTGGYDWVNLESNPIDDNGHGTHCAGIAAATINNAIGIAGVSNVSFIAEKVLDSGGNGYISDAISAIEHSVDFGVDVISMSFGCYPYSTALKNACDYAMNNGVTLVAAAGNDGIDTIMYPARFSNVISVGAIDQSDSLCDFSNYGSDLDVVAPGLNIYSTYPDNQYVQLSGTSMACPHVSGLAALIKSEFYNITNDQLVEKIKQNTVDLGDPGKDELYGYGKINVNKSVHQNPPTASFIYLPSDWDDRTTIKFIDKSFDSEHQIVNWSWDFDDGNTSYEQNPLHDYTLDGEYTVQLIVKDESGETDNLSSSIVIPYQSKEIEVNSSFTDNPASHQWDTIQEGINDALPGDTVFIYNGTYEEEIQVSSKENIIICGESQIGTILSGGISIQTDNITISNITIINGFEHDSIHKIGLFLESDNSHISNITFQEISAEDGSDGSDLLSDGGLGGSVNCILIEDCYGLCLENIYINNITAGDGGDGNIMGTGGNGGSISSFELNNVETINLSSISIKNLTAGNGGIGGDSANGGIGGDSYGFVTWSTENIEFISLNISNIRGGKGGNGGVGADGSIGGYSYGLLGFQTNHSTFNSITLQNISGGDKGLAGLGGTAGLNGLGLGMYIEESNNNSFSSSSLKNIISGSLDISYGLYSYQSHDNNWYNNSIATGISQNAYGTYLASSNSNIFKNNNLTSGIGAQGADGGTDVQANGKSGGNSYGLYIENSFQNKFLNNSIISDNAGNGGNGGTGTYVNGGDGGNTYGIYFLYSDLNSFHNNSICSGDAGNGGDGGAGMYSSGGDGGSSYGLYAEYSSSNHFENNTLHSGEEGDAGTKGAGMYGSNGINGEDIGLILMEESDSNILFHNSVINDDSLAFDECVNQYYNGSNQGGNYWSGHSCVGNPSDGSYPYCISGGSNIDLYPFETDKGWMLNSLPETSFTYEPNAPDTFDTIFFNSTSFDSDGTIVNWSWNMGDGSLLYGEQVTHSYSNDGAYIVQLETTDNEEGINSSSTTINIQNRPPVAEDDEYTTEEDTSIWIDVLSNDYDIDGYLKADTINVISGPTQGNTTTNSTTGFIQYSPYSDFSGLDAFVYQISDDDGAVDTATVTVDVGEVNDPPIANDDSDSCDEDGSTWTNVISNDNDSDDFLDLSTLQVISPASHGNTLVNHSTGKIKYNPEPNWNGVDLYTYQIHDESGASDTAIVTITVYDINDPPIADFDIEPNNPMTNQKIYLNSTSSDIDGIIVNSTWIIDESTILYGNDVIHEFSDDGGYSIELIILDDDGESASLEKTVSINNQEPIAQFSYNPINPRPNQCISFTDESTDLDGFISYIHWDFGDGNSSLQQNPDYTYTSSGTYIVTLTIKDDDNSIDTIQKQITVNEGPIANFSWTPKYPTIGNNVYFYDTSEFDESSIVNWTWDFDDGNISYEQNPVHTYNRFITYNNVTLTIRDNQSHTQSITKKIISQNTYEEYILGNETTCINLSSEHIQIWVNSTNETNMTINHYSENPLLSPSTFSLLNKLYSIIVNDPHLIQWPIYIQIYYSQSDLDSIGLIESQLIGLCFWNESESQWQLFNDTGVNTTYNGQGYDGYVWVDAWHLTNISIVADDIPPTQVSGLTVTDAKDGKLDISWSEAVDNIIIDHYEIYRDSKLIQTLSSTSFRDTGLQDGTSYSYQIAAVDSCGNRGDLSNSVNGKPTSSTVNTQPSGGGGGLFVPPGPSGPVDNAPVANISIDSKTGFIGETIVFDGSNSYDEEGNITSWEWDFGDGTISSGSKVSHKYQKTDLYSVSLTVRDESNNSDSCQVSIQIVQPNRPPEMIIFSGLTNGSVNIPYEYSFSANDADNDSMYFVIDWGDGSNSTKSDMVEQNKSISLSHSWDEPGVYLISVYAIDSENATSSVWEKEMLIDVMYCQDIGYLIDEDQDGEYDTLYCNETNEITNLGKKGNSSYLLDVDDDGEWDYRYTIDGGLASIGLKKIEGTPGFSSLILIIAFITVLLIFGIIRKSYQ